MTGLATPNAKSAEKFLSKSVHLKPNSRARYATYLKGFLNYLDIPFNVKVKVPKTLPDYGIRVCEVQLMKGVRPLFWFGPVVEFFLTPANFPI